MANLPQDDPVGQDPLVPSDDKNKSGGGGTGTARGKERLDGAGKQEVTPMTEYTRKVDLEPEVESWLEKLEKEDKSLQQPVMDDSTGQVILDSTKGGQGSQKGDFKVVLPLTKDEVEKGLHHKVVDSIRWMAEWCIRMIKMFGKKVAYKKEK